jgi:hypothetical protein
MSTKTQSPKLRQVWVEWLAKYRTLSSSFDISIAAPFFSSAHVNYPVQQRGVLFVGKATDRNYFLSDFENDLSVSDEAAIEGRIGCNRKLVENDQPSTAFWNLFAALSVAADNGEEFENMIWTNICKIGPLSGPPTDLLLNRQKELAIKTLQIEIEEYSPSLVVFVSGKYASDVVIAVTKKAESEWVKSDTPGFDSGVWWLKSLSPNIPSFLWTMHPQFKSNSEKQTWVRRAIWLMKDR